MPLVQQAPVVETLQLVCMQLSPIRGVPPPLRQLVGVFIEQEPLWQQAVGCWEPQGLLEQVCPGCVTPPLLLQFDAVMSEQVCGRQQASFLELEHGLVTQVWPL